MNLKDTITFILSISILGTNAVAQTSALAPSNPAEKLDVRQSTTSKRGTPAKQAIKGLPLVPLKNVENQNPLEQLNAGDTAPDFMSIGENGSVVKLSDFKGKVVVLDFWATWCGPCLASLPHTAELAKQYKEKDVIVLAVCTGDTRAKFDQWVKVNRKKYTNIVFTCDPNEKGSTTFDERASRKLYGVSGIPSQFVIDRNGKVVATIRGYLEEDSRLEAGLGRAGISIHPDVAAKGEAQFGSE